MHSENLKATDFTANPGYWYHFKNITMANIKKDCELNFKINGIELVKQVWVQWYNSLCMCIQRLGMDARGGGAAAAAGVWSCFFISLGKQPMMHLSCILPRSTTTTTSSSRWRLKCGV